MRGRWNRQRSSITQTKDQPPDHHQAMPKPHPHLRYGADEASRHQVRLQIIHPLGHLQRPWPELLRRQPQPRDRQPRLGQRARRRVLVVIPQLLVALRLRARALRAPLGGGVVGLRGGGGRAARTLEAQRQLAEPPDPGEGLHGAGLEGVW